MSEPQIRYGQTTTGAGVAIDEGLRKYMLGVYNYMALGVAATGVFALFVGANEPLMTAMLTTPLRWLPFVGVLALGWFSPKVIFTGSRVLAHTMFWAYAAMWGLLIAPWLYVFQAQGMAQEIYRAFFIAAAIFGSLSLFGYTTKRDMSNWSSILTVTGVVLLLGIILNALIFQSSMMSLVVSSLVVIFMSAVIAFETQMIKSMYQDGAGEGNERAAIFGAFALYGSFVTLFIHLLNILGIMRE